MLTVVSDIKFGNTFQKYVILLNTNFCTMLRNNQKYFVVTAVK